MGPSERHCVRNHKLWSLADGKEGLSFSCRFHLSCQPTLHVIAADRWD